MKRKILTVAGLSACLALGSLAGCGQKEDAARIYYLNYKPESTDAWKEIAEVYEEKTGVESES